MIKRGMPLKKTKQKKRSANLITENIFSWMSSTWMSDISQLESFAIRQPSSVAHKQITVRSLIESMCLRHEGLGRMRSARRFSAAVRRVNSGFLSIRALRQRSRFTRLPPPWSGTGDGELGPCCRGEHKAGRHTDRGPVFTFPGSSRLHRGSFLRRPQVRWKFKVSRAGGIGAGGGGGKVAELLSKSRVLFDLDKV